MIQPAFFIGDLPISEPVNCLTDWLVAFVAFWAFLKLRKISAASPARPWFIGYFLMLGLATFFGGLFGHALLLTGPFGLMKMPGWLPGLASVVCLEMVFCRLAAPFLNKNWQKRLPTLIALKAAACLFMVVGRFKFEWIQVHAFLGMVGVIGPLAWLIFKKCGHRGSLKIFQALGLMSLASLVFSFRLSEGSAFSHVDWSHLLWAAATWLFYRSAVLFLEKEPTNQLFSSQI